jgi:hypothetical protein
MLDVGLDDSWELGLEVAAVLGVALGSVLRLDHVDEILAG